MKRPSLFLFAVIVVAGLLVPAALSFAQTRAEFTEVTGKVEYRLGSGPWREATAGAVIDANTTISTGFNSRAVLSLGPSVVEVSQLTRMVLEDIVEQQGTTETSLFLNVGRVRADVRTTEGRSADFRVRSPISTAAVRGTSFEFDGEKIEVEEGTVAIINRNGKTQTVRGGQSSVTNGDDPAANPQDLAENEVVVSIAPIGADSDDESEYGDDDGTGSSDDTETRSTRGTIVIEIK